MRESGSQTGVISRLSLSVSRKARETADVVSFDLVDPAGNDLPRFTAGAHIDVYLDDGLVRQYSLFGDSEDRSRYRIAVKRANESRGGSLYLHESVRAGETLRVSVPRNSFPLVESQRRPLLLAAGIGITPILSMAEYLAQSGADFSLQYFARSREQAAFHEQISKSAFADRTSFHFNATGTSGPHDLLDRLIHESADAEAYICGPGSFIDAVRSRCVAAGWAPERLHWEYFGATPVSSTSDRVFEVQLARCGTVYRIPVDKTVAQVLIENGVQLARSCEQGVCGTCLTRVLGGVVDHRDQYLTQDEKAANECFMPCVSRAAGDRLVLDL